MNSQENKNVFDALPIKMEQGSPTFKFLVGNSRRNKNSLKTKKFFGLEEFGLKAKSKLNTVLLPTTFKNQDQRVIDKNH